ncbi:MAG: FtsX-like permease family protein, partial [Chloroflexota bacterium]
VVNDAFLDLLHANTISTSPSSTRSDVSSIAQPAQLSTVYIGNKRFSIVGVMKDSDFFGGFPRVVVPISLLGQSLYSQSMQWHRGMLVVDSVDVLAVDVEQVEAAKLDVERILRLGHDLNQHQKNDFFINDQRQTLETINNLNRGLTLVLGGIGSISLIVGGIGIMNIMLATVSERTREIGIRKAVGASNRDVLMQFLTEAVTVCLTGGLLGVIVSYGLSVLVGLLIPEEEFGDIGIIIDLQSVLTASLFSIGAGILFGLYPALRAMRLDPIDALRTE